MFVRCIAAGVSLVLLLGCAPGATPNAPTVQAGATQVAKEVQAGATQVAPSVQSGATQVGKTVGQAVGASPVQITDVGLSSGDATITLRNTSADPVDLSGWQVRVGDQAATLPSGARVPPGQSLTLHTAGGTSTGTDLYLGTQADALRGSLQRGARVALVDDRGNVVGDFVIP